MNKQEALENLDLNHISAGVILNTLADGAYVTDRMRRILFWNRSAERITGWTSGEVIGRSCKDNILVHIDKDGHPLCGHAFCPLHRAMVTGERSPAPMLVFAQSKTGGRVPVEVMVSPIRNAEGKVVGGIEVFRDISQGMDDLRRARTIQSHAMEIPANDDARVAFHVHAIPNELVGGDFFRVEKIDEDHYAIMIADVSGHGLTAALYTMQLRTLWEEYRALLGDPPSFLSALNARLNLFASRDDHFATALHIRYNAATGEAVIACAGHLPPFVIRGRDNTRVDTQGPALGLVSDASYSASTTNVAPGEQLLLVTDGAVEIHNRDGVELGEEGLAGMLKTADLSRGDQALGEIEERMLAYSNHVRLPDDLTLLLLRRPA